MFRSPWVKASFYIAFGYIGNINVLVFYTVSHIFVCINLFEVKFLFLYHFCLSGIIFLFSYLLSHSALGIKYINIWDLSQGVIRVGTLQYGNIVMLLYIAVQ